jgi:hypothetical protein
VLSLRGAVPFETLDARRSIRGGTLAVRHRIATSHCASRDPFSDIAAAVRTATATAAAVILAQARIHFEF